MAVKHVVGVSGGKDSTCLALALKEKEPRNYLYLYTPTGDELPDMVAHMERLEVLLDAPILRICADRSLNEMIDATHTLPNHNMRWCTPALKIEPAQKFFLDNAPVVSYVGLRADEETRVGAVYATGSGIVSKFPFREWGWGEKEVWSYLDERGVCIPKRTDCARCYDQRLPEWRNLLNEHPDIYANAEEQEKRSGHTFRSPARDNWPAALKDLRVEFESGRVLRQRKKDVERSCRACSL